jgi:hypothetical protein
MKQPSTWQGLVGAAAVLGYQLDPDQIEAIVTIAGTALFILHGLKDDDKGATQTKEQWIQRGRELGLLKTKRSK